MLPRLLRTALLLLLLSALPIAPAGARDRGADGNFEQRESSHFILFQDVDIDRAGGWRGSVQFERDVLAVLEQGYDQLDARLGLRPPRKIQVWVYDPAIFDATFAGLFRFRIAGFYGEAIRVRGDTVVTARLSRTLHHELVHAAFDAAAPSLVLPAWLNEGIAEWFENRTHGKRGLSAAEWAYLRQAHQGGFWIPVTSSGASNFGWLRGNAAALAYLESYALVDALVRRRGERDLPRFIQTLVRTRNLDRALRRVYKVSLADLEPDLRAELD